MSREALNRTLWVLEITLLTEGGHGAPVPSTGSNGGCRLSSQRISCASGAAKRLRLRIARSTCCKNRSAKSAAPACRRKSPRGLPAASALT